MKRKPNTEAVRYMLRHGLYEAMADHNPEHLQKIEAALTEVLDEYHSTVSEAEETAYYDALAAIKKLAEKHGAQIVQAIAEANTVAASDPTSEPVEDIKVFTKDLNLDRKDEETLEERIAAATSAKEEETATV